nr:hypothetical protein [Shigella flexneri]
MQTEFADRIGQRHGLERGIERSKARHQTIRQFYGNLEAADRQQIAVDPKQVAKKASPRRSSLLRWSRRGCRKKSRKRIGQPSRRPL